MSLDELIPFMDWAASRPSEPEDYEEFLAASEAGWIDGSEYNFVITEVEIGEVIGCCGLMRRVGPGSIEIGYWIRSDRTGRGLATEAAGLLTEAARALDDVDRVQIHHDAANIASGRVAEKLGYTVHERRDVEIDNPGEIGLEVVWIFEFSGR